MDFSQNMSMEEAFALAEAEAKLTAALQESKLRFEQAAIPDRLNENWRFGRPHKHAKALAELLQSNEPTRGEARIENAEETATSISGDDEDLRQTELLMPSIGSDALLGLHLHRFGHGYALYIESDTKEPIHITYTAAGLYTPSTFIMIAPGVKAEIIEHHISSAAQATLFATRNIQVAEGAELKLTLHSSGLSRYMCITNIQNIGGKVRHLTKHQGNAWTREETIAEICAAEADIQLYSANQLTGEEVLDQHTKQIHHIGGTTSNLLYKNVVDERATAIFAGNIYVAPGAHHTDAYQSNRNMLLSEKATVHSLPGLEILADKVRCSHGSASAPMDAEQLFYLRSRGIPMYEAQSLVAQGFLEDVCHRFGCNE